MTRFLESQHVRREVISVRFPGVCTLARRAAGCCASWLQYPARLPIGGPGRDAAAAPAWRPDPVGASRHRHMGARRLPESPPAESGCVMSAPRNLEALLSKLKHVE